MRLSPRLFGKFIAASLRNLWPSRRFVAATVHRRARRSLQRGRSGYGSVETLEARLALAHTAVELVTMPLSSGSLAVDSQVVQSIAPAAGSSESVLAAAGIDPALVISHFTGLDATLGSVFGHAGTPQATFATHVAQLDQQLPGGFSALGVRIQVLDKSVMGVHEGAYSATAAGGPTIFIRSDLLQGPESKAILQSVLLEETGHHIDYVLNGSLDSPGDEGEQFSAIVRGQALVGADLARVTTENDHGTLVVNGLSVPVEFATATGQTTTLAYTEAAAKVAMQPGVVITRSSATENVTSVVLSIGTPNTSDRISVAGAAGTNGAAVVAGITVPAVGAANASGSFSLGGIAWTYSLTAGGSCTFTNTQTGAASATAAQALLRALRYDSTSANPVTTTRIVSFFVPFAAAAQATFTEALTITAVNQAPTITATTPVPLTEAIAGAAGVSTASSVLTRADADSPLPTYDPAFLLANGWILATGGATYSKLGTYGTATLTIATNTVAYILNNALTATQLLTTGQVVTDTFLIQVRDTSNATAQGAVVFTINGRNDPPTLTAAAATAALVESGVGVVGSGSSTVLFTKSDIEGAATYDAAWLAANAWSTTNAGLTYTKNGRYGTATLTVATNILSYALNNSLAATQLLKTGQTVTESILVQVTDSGNAKAQAAAVFSIVGSNDGPSLTGAATVYPQGDNNQRYTLSPASLIAGYTDPEADPLVVLGLTATSLDGTVVFAVTADATGNYLLDPAGYIGTAVLSYTVSDVPAVGVAGSIAATNNVNFLFISPPTVIVTGPNPPDIIEDGGINNTTVGVPTAVAQITKSDLQTTATYNTPWMLANGWVASATGFTHAGTYGSAVLDVALDTLTYTLNNALPATERLGDGDLVSDLFNIQVTDGTNVTNASAAFPILGSNDAPRLTGTVASFANGVEDVTYTFSIAGLTQGYTDPEAGAISAQNFGTSSGTFLDLGNGFVALTPGANYNGPITFSYDVVDTQGAAYPTVITIVFTAAADAPVPKRFAITVNDLTFLNSQASVPIVTVVRYLTNGTGIYGYTDPNTKLVVELGQLGTFDLLTSPWAAFLPPVVTPAATTPAGPSEPYGLRNVQGLFNNISGPKAAAWGAAFTPFARSSNANYSNYMTGPANLAAQYANPFATVNDSTPRMISQTVDSYAALERVELAAPGTITDHNIYQVTDVTTGLPTVGGFDADGLPLAGGLYFVDDFIRNLNTLAGDPTLTGWSVIFGQFLDHGLDFIGKGGNTTAGVSSKVYIPLDPTDPLYDPANGVTRLSISRATVNNPLAAGRDGMFRTADDIISPGYDNIYGTADDVNGPTNPDYINHVSPYIDQSQTYGSDDSTTNLLRQWVVDPVSGRFVAGMYLFDGATLAAPYDRPNPDGTVTSTSNTLPTLNELRKHIITTGRADISWNDVGNLRARDAAGQILDLDPATAGIQPKLTDHTLIADMLPRLDAAHVLIDPLAGVPNHVDLLAGFAGIQRPATGSVPTAKYVSDYINVVTGTPTATGLLPANGAILAEILLRSVGDHYVAGDGRVNENFALTSIHHVWHENHNWQIDNTILSIATSQAADPTKTFAHSFQVAINGANGLPRTDALGNYVDATGKISWNLEKMFQVGVFVNQNEYQHVAIDQYARGHSPNVPLFVMYDSGVNADVTLDYSQVAFRFGHSELREVIDALDPNGSLTAAVTHYSLEQAFLNPAGFATVGPAAIAHGMSRQAASELDEFITPALQQKLLGQPQDLAAINIARARDLGMPTLNDLRTALSGGMAAEIANLQGKLLAAQATHAGVEDPNLRRALDKTIALSAGLQPYTSWTDFAKNIQNADSINNFIAAYSFNGDITKADAVVKMAKGAIYTGLSTAEQAAIASLGWTPANAAINALMFMGTGTTADKGFNKIDAWNGGLAEKHVFLGELGSTFDTIFCDQMTRLINGDRDYYFWRLQLGLPIFTELSTATTTEQFKDVIERNTGAKHLNGNVMFMADSYVEVGENPNSIASGADRDHKYGDLVQAQKIGVFSDFGFSEILNGAIVNQGGLNYIMDSRPDFGLNPDGTAAWGFNSHEVVAGTLYPDYIDLGDGDDTGYGDLGDDILLGNAGADHIYGEGGNDTIYGGSLPDFLDGGPGNDIIHAGDDADVSIGSDGNDIIFGEAGVDELDGGAGDDYLDGGTDVDTLFAGVGQDILYGGEGLDTNYGEWGDDRMFGGAGPDQLFGGYGDDILNGGTGGQSQNLNVDEALGEFGYNLVSFSDLNVPLNKVADLHFQNVNMAVSTPFGQLWVNINGVEGSALPDQIVGDAGNNWLIGGGDNDVIFGDAGDDVIVLDSMRLDTLIGTYNAAGVLQANGVLDAVPAGDGKHFLDLLKSVPTFTLGQIAVLGGAGGIVYNTPVAGTGDTVCYAGGRWNFTITAVMNPTVPTQQIGIRVVDNTGVETSAVGDLIIGAENILFGFNFTAANAASTSGYLPLTPTAITALLGNAYPVASIAGATLSTSVATLAGYASVTSAAPLDTTVGVTLPANTLSFTIPAAAAATRILGATWQSYNPTTLVWTNIPGSTGLTFRPSAANGLAQGTTVRAVADFLTATNQMRYLYSNASAPLGLEVVGTAAADTLLGTAFQDVIYAGAGNDSLDGLAGADYMEGGAGNDTYAVDNIGDVVVEAAAGGTDTVSSAITYTLGANVENLTLAGVAAINGTGNALANVLIANTAVNTLTGGALADTFRYLTVGTGSLSTSTALDTITDFVIGTDIFDSTTARTAGQIRRVLNVAGAYSATTLAAQFTTANFAANSAALVTFAGTANAFYLVINDATAGYTAGTDFVIRVNYTGTLANFAIA